jgi:hypothetical protein
VLPDLFDYFTFIFKYKLIPSDLVERKKAELVTAFKRATEFWTKEGRQSTARIFQNAYFKFLSVANVQHVAILNQHASGAGSKSSESPD